MDRQKLRSCVQLITYTVLLVALLIKIDTVIELTVKLFLLLEPIIIGAVLAFVLKLPFDRLTVFYGKILPEKLKKTGFAFSLLTVYLLLFGAFAVIAAIVVPQLAESVMMLKSSLTVMTPSINGWVEDAQLLLAAWGIELADYEKFLREFSDMLGKLLLDSVPRLFMVTNSVVQTVTNIVLGLVFSVYMLICRKKLAEQAVRAIKAFFSEKRAAVILHISDVCNRTFTKFVGGQLTEAVILGSLCFVGMVLLRLEYALLISVMIGVTSLVPIVGAFVGAAPAAFILLMISPRKAVVFLIFLVVLQQLEGNIIYPKVVGGSLGLPALWILTAITVGGGMFGVAGMLLAVPVTSVIYQLLGEEIKRRLEQKREEKEQGETA